MRNDKSLAPCEFSRPTSPVVTLLSQISIQHTNSWMVPFQNPHVRRMFVYGDKLCKAFRQQARNKILADQPGSSADHNFSVLYLCHSISTLTTAYANRPLEQFSSEHELSRQLWTVCPLP